MEQKKESRAVELGRLVVRCNIARRKANERRIEKQIKKLGLWNS